MTKEAGGVGNGAFIIPEMLVNHHHLRRKVNVNMDWGKAKFHAKELRWRAYDAFAS